MRRSDPIFVFLATAAVLLLGAASAGATPVKGFVDEFKTLDTTRWTVPPAHVLGRSTLEPANTRVGGGQLQLHLHPDSLEGAELRSNAPFDAGVFSTRLQVANAPDSLTGFFLYSPPDYAHEIDVEIYNDPAGRAILSTYDGGSMTHTVEVALPFDPTAAMHDYAITTKNGGVQFTADGVVLQSWAGGAPRAPMNLYVNAWFPQWLGGTPPVEEQRTTIESIAFSPR